MHCEVCAADEAHPTNAFNFAINLCAIHHRAMFDFLDEDENMAVWIEYQDSIIALRRAGYPSVTGMNDQDTVARRMVEAERACRDALRSWFRKAKGDYQSQNVSIEGGGEAT